MYVNASFNLTVLQTEKIDHVNMTFFKTKDMVKKKYYRINLQITSTQYYQQQNTTRSENRCKSLI